MRREEPITTRLHHYLYPLLHDPALDAVVDPLLRPPADWNIHVKLHLIPEIRAWTRMFYGPRHDTQLAQDRLESKYPGVNYSLPSHIYRLAHYKHHKKLFEAIEALGLTDWEVYETCCWEGSLKARHVFERGHGVKVRDVLGCEGMPLEPSQRPVVPSASEDAGIGRTEQVIEEGGDATTEAAAGRTEEATEDGGDAATEATVEDEADAGTAEAEQRREDDARPGSDGGIGTHNVNRRNRLPPLLDFPPIEDPFNIEFFRALRAAPRDALVANAHGQPLTLTRLIGLVPHIPPTFEEFDAHVAHAAYAAMSREAHDANAHDQDPVPPRLTFPATEIPSFEAFMNMRAASLERRAATDPTTPFGTGAVLSPTRDVWERARSGMETPAEGWGRSLR